MISRKMFDDWYTVIKITWILIELFSIGWVLQNQNPSNLLIWPVRKEIDDTVNQSKLGANTSSWSQARVNMCEQVRLVLVWLLLMKSGAPVY